MTVMSHPEALAILADRIPAPDWLDLSNYASAHYIAGDLALALRYARNAVLLARNSSTLLNLGVILEASGQFREALALFAEAQPLDPDNIVLGGALADGLLRVGRWAEGWPLYTRYHAAPGGLARFLPEWTGRESLRGKRILVHEGGGFGDSFYFLRWLPRLTSWGAHITYAAPPSLLVLLALQPYIAAGLATVDAHIMTLDFRPWNYFTSVLALGHKLGVTPQDVLWRGPYIAAPVRPCPLSRRRPRVGLCWRAGEGNYPRAHRTLTDAQRDRIVAAAPHVQWVSLTRDHTLPGARWQPRLYDWSDTAAAIAALDLVVTVDTGVAHCAGAMGKPVWVILPGASAWQYGLDSDRSLMYPSMRLFRNHGEGNDSAVAALARALEAL